MSDYSEIVIIGSGFGGAVMAARLGAHVKARFGDSVRVEVVEKGGDHTAAFDPTAKGPPLNAQGNRFRHTYDLRYLAGLTDVFTDIDGAFRAGVPSFNVLAGKGIGGGSNVYAGVSLRAPAEIFAEQQDGRPLWPKRYSRAALAPHYDSVAKTLHVNRLRWTDKDVPHWQLCTKRDLVFAEGCRRVGITALPVPLASENDANEGWWTQGQRFSGRQNLSQNYLAQAKAAGVRFSANVEVQRIEPFEKGYLVRGVDSRGGAQKPFERACKIVIVAAGAIASTGLLLRSRPHFQGARELDAPLARGAAEGILGKRVSGNGDYGVSGRIADAHAEAVESHKGKPIASFCPSLWKQHKVLILPFHADPLYLALGQISTLLRADRPQAAGRASARAALGADGRQERHWGAAYKARLSRFSERVLSMGCLAVDENEGEITLGPSGAPQVRWRETSVRTERRWNAALDAMRRIYEALGGEMYLDGYRKDGTVNTSHPLGGARMAEDGRYGVVGDDGQAFGNRNLFVVDGSVIPSALGVNPSMTIAAVAESIAARLITGDGTESLEARLAA